MKKRVFSILAIAAAFGVFNGHQLPALYEPKVFKPKNKYNLTEEEIEQMADMSPKEKKQFLKSRSTAVSDT
jgi:predicted DNA-binding antitoxin AbrB/MazE fold protein